MKKKFGIDIDDTLIKVWEDEIINNYNKKYNKNLEYDDIKSHNFNDDENLKKEFFDYFYKNHSNLKLFPGVKEKLEEIKGEYDFYLITSRPLIDIDFTQNDIEKIFGKGYFKKIIFTCEYGEDKKCILAENLGFDMVIDDATHHIENYINNTNIKKIFIFNQPWNRELKEDNKRVFRIKKWSEINI